MSDIELLLDLLRVSRAVLEWRCDTMPEFSEFQRTKLARVNAEIARLCYRQNAGRSEP